jgi:nitrogen fixation/metabolism regulation signal transduction histidine kinase
VKLRLPGRFEWKILGAMLIVTSLPLAAAAYSVRGTLNRIQLLTEEYQDSVHRSLSGALEVYRSYFTEMKDNFRGLATEIAATPFSRASDLADVPDLLRARILQGNEVVDEWEQPPDVQQRAQAAPPSLVALPVGRDGGEPRLLELTFGISREIYSSYQALRESIEREAEVNRVLPVILTRYFRGVALALIIVLAIAAAMGLFVARRATGRVATLRDAARRVGEGDLDVRVAPRGSDELDELGRAFDRMVAELGDARSRLGYLQKVSAWQEVARRLAHEIKNPLTPIQLAVQELASKYNGGDPAYKRLLATAQEILTEEVGAIRRLVDDFSAFAKLPKVEPEPLDLAQVVEDFARAHPEWHDALKLAPNGHVGALCDRMMLGRVLANLVENAAQAATEAGRQPQIHVAVTSSAAENAAQILVDDNGPGVPDKLRDRIFDPYFTSKAQGTGLGLAIVRKIMLDHGGDIRVDDKPSPLGGARFVVTLPTADGARTTGPRAAALPVPAPVPLQGDDRRPR